MQINRRYAIQTIGFIGMINSIIFLLIELFFAELIKDYAQAHENQNGLLMMIIMIGYLLSGIISIVSTLIGSEYLDEKQRVYVAVLMAFIFNMLLWIIVSYIMVLKQFPTVLSNLTWGEKIIVFPKVMMYFAIYILPNLTLLWLMAGWTNAIIFVILLHQFGVQLHTKIKSFKGGTFF